MSEKNSSAPITNNVFVAVRVRPLKQQELQVGQRSCCHVINDRQVVIKKLAKENTYLRSQLPTSNEYAFDAVFDEESTQDEVYERTAKQFLDKLFVGQNITVFAYGATGAGKTHTMLGNTRIIDEISQNNTSIEDASGIIPNAVKDVFKMVNENNEINERIVQTKYQENQHLYSQQNSSTPASSHNTRKKGAKGSKNVAPAKVELFQETFYVTLSFVEVYNEQVYDLLDNTGNVLQVREDKEKNLVVAAGMTEVTVSTPEEVINYIIQGNKVRKTEATMANVLSSRSHAILTLTLKKAQKPYAPALQSTSNPNKVKYYHHSHSYFDNDNHSNIIMEAKLSLIDLAGSERASATNNKGIRLTEGANINKSLLALANCINALADNSINSNQETSTSSKKLVNVKYRDSKLTHLLKTSLEGRNSYLIMIANINPSHTTYEDSHNTLKYANRAKNIKVMTNPVVINSSNNHSISGNHSNQLVVSSTAEDENDFNIENEQLKQLLEQIITERNMLIDFQRAVLDNHGILPAGYPVKFVAEIPNNLQQYIQTILPTNKEITDEIQLSNHPNNTSSDSLNISVSSLSTTNSQDQSIDVDGEQLKCRIPSEKSGVVTSSRLLPRKSFTSTNSSNSTESKTPSKIPRNIIFTKSTSKKDLQGDTTTTTKESTELTNNQVSNDLEEGNEISLHTRKRRVSNLPLIRPNKRQSLSQELISTINTTEVSTTQNRSSEQDVHLLIDSFMQDFENSKVKSNPVSLNTSDIHMDLEVSAASIQEEIPKKTTESQVNMNMNISMQSINISRISDDDDEEDEIQGEKFLDMIIHSKDEETHFKPISSDTMNPENSFDYDEITRDLFQDKLLFSSSKTEKPQVKSVKKSNIPAIKPSLFSPHIPILSDEIISEQQKKCTPDGEISRSQVCTTKLRGLRGNTTKSNLQQVMNIELHQNWTLDSDQTQEKEKQKENQMTNIEDEVEDISDRRKLRVSVGAKKRKTMAKEISALLQSISLPEEIVVAPAAKDNQDEIQQTTQVHSENDTTVNNNNDNKNNNKPATTTTTRRGNKIPVHSASSTPLITSNKSPLPVLLTTPDQPIQTHTSGSTGSSKKKSTTTTTTSTNIPMSTRTTRSSKRKSIAIAMDSLLENIQNINEMVIAEPVARKRQCVAKSSNGVSAIPTPTTTMHSKKGNGKHDATPVNDENDRQAVNRMSTRRRGNALQAR